MNWKRIFLSHFLSYSAAYVRCAKVFETFRGFISKFHITTHVSRQRQNFLDKERTSIYIYITAIRNLTVSYLFLSLQMAPSSGDHAANVPSLSTRTSSRQPTMGLLDAINLLLACIIGSGIFISAKAVLENSGSYGFSIVVWISCGLLCIMVWEMFKERNAF